MNHRFLLRLITNLAVILLTFSCFGIVLWVIDEFLRWDILPDAWSLLVQAALISGSVIAFVLVIMNALLSLSLLAESNASRAGLPDYVISMRSRQRINRGIVAGLVAIALLIAGLQITNHFRTQIAEQSRQADIAKQAAEYEATFTQTKTDLDASMEQVLSLFTAPLLEAIDTNTLVEKGQLGNFSKLANSIQDSFPHAPIVNIISPAAQPPFKYARITKASITSNQNGLSLQPQLFTTFPTAKETQAVQQLLAGEVPTITAPLKGQIINNTIPSSWGVLKRDGRIVAAIYIQAAQSPQGYPIPYNNQNGKEDELYHTGPESLLSN